MAIVVSYGVAATLPQSGLWMRQVDLSVGGDHLPLLPAMLGLLLFNAGLGVPLRELIELRRMPQKGGVLLAGMIGNLAAPLTMILVVLATMSLWHNADEAQQILVGLALVAAMPIDGASTAVAQNANGNLVVSLGLVLLTTLLSPLTTPLVLHAVGFLTIGDYSEDLHTLASGEATAFWGAWVIIPSLLGLFARRYIGDERFETAKPYVRLGNFIVLLLLNYSYAALVLPKTAELPDADLLAAVLVEVSSLCIAGFGSGLLLSRWLATSRDKAASLTFALGMNNNGARLVLASITLADDPQVMLPIICYNLVQHLFASLVDFALLRCAEQAAQAWRRLPPLGRE